MQDYPENPTKSKHNSRRATLPAIHTRQRRRPLIITITTYTERNAWGYVIRSIDGQLLASDFGDLPPGQVLAVAQRDHIALAAASRVVRSKMPAAHVAAVRCRHPFAETAERKAA